jgi:hypothetical protein
MTYYFRAYPVSLGDAFLVEDRGFRFLVDGGLNKTEIGDLLLGDGITTLDLVICTHLDADHVNGRLGILEGGEISVKALWVPEAWKEKIAVAASYREGLTRLASVAAGENGEGMRSFGAQRLSFEDVLRLEQPVRGRYGSGENVAEADVADETLAEAENTVDEVLQRYGDNLVGGDVDTLSSLRIACNIIRFARRTGTEMTFWRYTDRLELARHDDFVSFNAEPTGTSSATFIRTGVSGLAVFALSQINKESLVFSYEPHEKAQIVFAADSGFNFLKAGAQIIPELGPYSIMTAPHHGSADPEHRRVYKAVAGQELCYVRSDNINQSRPGEAFLSIPNSYRFCTRCKYDETVQKVEFKYSRKRFRPASRPCPYADAG